MLHGFGESGNAYKAALMLELCRLDWEPQFVDYFEGETRTPEYRSKVNEMGEVPVLVHGAKTLTQSGVILDYLAEQTRKFGAKSDDERREILRWMLFDNHKFTSYIGDPALSPPLRQNRRNAGDGFPARARLNRAQDRRRASGRPALHHRQARDDRRSLDVRLSVLWR